METTQNTNDYKPDIYTLNDEYLLTECKRFSFVEPPINPIHFSNSLTTTRHKLNGIGLAANQVGFPWRVISVRGMESALFNPTILLQSDDEQVTMEEGCLSYPGLLVKIKRPSFIKIRYIDALEEVHIEEYGGMTARIIQHEIDHLDGKIFYKRANKFHRDQAMRRWKK